MTDQSTESMITPGGGGGIEADWGFITSEGFGGIEGARD